MKRAFYFGCRGGLGHYLHDTAGGRELYRLPDGMPWGLGHLDTGLLKNGGHEDCADGRVFWTCGGRPTLWYAFVWWDNSVDRRPGSNSGFYVEGFAIGEAPAAFQFAREQFPDVVARQPYTLTLIDRNARKDRAER